MFEGPSNFQVAVLFFLIMAFGVACWEGLRTVVAHLVIGWQ
jgi:hypothetical protein